MPISLANHTHPTATTSVAGFMSASDKVKLDGLTGGTGGSSISVVKYNVLGGLISGTGTIRWYPERDCTLTSVYFSLGGTANALQVKIDVRKNGLSILGGSYPTCSINSNKSNIVPISINMLISDYLTVDVLTSAGSDLVACITYS